MAIQTGPFLISCTLDGVCFYVADGQGRARVSNPPDAKRVKKALAFAGFRRYSDYLKQASPLASAMHKKLPAGRQRHHYQRLAGVAIRGMKAGGSMEVVMELMEKEMELIGEEIREGKVTAVVHGEQTCTIKWKDGEPVLRKRRRKTAILTSSAGIHQRQAFEELRRGEFLVESLELDSERSREEALQEAALPDSIAGAARKPVSQRKPGKSAEPQGLFDAGCGFAVCNAYRRSRGVRRRCIRLPDDFSSPARSRSLSAGSSHPPPG